VNIFEHRNLPIYKRKRSGGSLPNSHGPLSRTISSVAIESANSEVCEVYARQVSGCMLNSTKGKKRRVYSRAEMGKLTRMLGASEAAKRFTKNWGLTSTKGP